MATIKTPAARVAAIENTITTSNAELAEITSKVNRIMPLVCEGDKASDTQLDALTARELALKRIVAAAETALPSAKLELLA